MQRSWWQMILTMILGLTLGLPNISLGQAVSNGYLSVYDYGSLNGAVDDNQFSLSLGQWVADYNLIKKHVQNMPDNQAEQALVDGYLQDELAQGLGLQKLNEATQPILQRWAETWNVHDLAIHDQKVIHLLQEYGIKLASAEGMGFLVVDWNYLNPLLLTDPSPEVLAYLAVKNNQPERLFADAAHIYSVHEMGSWAVQWEQFLGQYNNKTYQQLAGQEYHLFMNTILLSNMDNTPAFPSWNKGQMEDHWIQDLQAVVSNHPDTQTASIINDFLTTIAKDNFTLSLATEELFTQRISAVYQSSPAHQEGATKLKSRPKPLTAVEKKLLGQHMFSLQWISWEQFGIATITQEESGLYIQAVQELDGDYVTLTGHITIKDEKEFMVTGELITCVHHINTGEPCIRNEVFTFKNTGTRKYWRLQEMHNPCDQPVLDYVDIFF